MSPIVIMLALLFPGQPAADTFETDTFQTDKGNLAITFIGHGTLMMMWDGKIIHIDPVSREADYSKLPKADLVLITHEHDDHLDPATIARLRKPGTKVIVSKSCEGKVPGETILLSGQSATDDGIGIDAVPAYNLLHKRPDGKPFHPKGNGNGYVLTMGGKRIYIAGDTENIPEMKNLKDIDIAFLPMNLPYTMTPGQTAEAARSFMPKILYPYHFGQTDPQKLVELLKDTPIDVRVRKME
ncbi:MBL fold metallo-hydrolase [Prolixibacter sp. SD074]|jgi:L-ascorbate metabolism protein UlaG (beta-lactamase superfamily)|uniref:MBL fold metallo-hydrolase n=1 Tax=Prolixibacter sp. SD074 TaxID=2652391 RepID=UPI00127BEC78|nr:MBL fold metallo-hydrolase [Prolixibacter sp. SD074]GET28998.1 metal-dependent hydrolase [Prolixibacter sp. SD074]